MRFSIATTLLALSSAANAASSWGFKDGSVTVASKGAASEVTEKFSATERVKKALELGHTELLKLSVTTQEGSSAKRPHQAFLVLREASGLEVPFPLTVKESGKGSVKIGHRDLPVQFIKTDEPIQASLVLGSFGSTKASVSPVFELKIKRDSSHPPTTYKAPLRYGKLPEIHHIFRADPKNPPKIISLVFALAVVAAVPVLFISWLVLGGNVADLGSALASAPIAHALFFGSIIAMEGVFFLYYSSWNLFQTLPVIGLVGVVAFLSGNSALAEVQSRRLAGKR